MRILHFATRFFPECLGPTTRLYNLLSRLPYQVDVVTVGKMETEGGVNFLTDSFGNVKSHRIFLKAPFLGPRAIRQLPDYLAVRSAVRNLILREALPQLIHAHETKWLTGRLGMEIAKTRRIPFFCEIHAVRKDYFQGASGFLYKFCADVLGKKVLRESDRIITLTNSLKRWLVAHYGMKNDKITVIPNGVDGKLFSPKAEYREKVLKIKHELGLEEAKVVMYAGYLDRTNGISDLIGCLPGMLEKGNTPVFFFIGQGPESGRIQALADRFSRKVKYVPFVPHDEMPVYYQLCDIFVIPRPSCVSSECLLPLKLLEAMAMGKIVVASNVGGVTEVIRDSVNGFLYIKGDMRSFRDVLVKALSGNCSEIGENARASVLNRYEWNASAEILRELYERYV